MSYIKREAAIKAIENDCSEAVYYTKRYAIDCLLAEPTADVEEVRHGEWEDKHCTVCGEPQPYTARGNAFATTFYQFKTKFCPNCGAKMDGERSGNGT